MTMWIETFFLLDPLYHMKDVMGTHNRIKKTFSLGKNMIEFTEYDRKNVPWHILAPRLVACGNLSFHASAHLWHVGAVERSF